MRSGHGTWVIAKLTLRSVAALPDMLPHCDDFIVSNRLLHVVHSPGLVCFADEVLAGLSGHHCNSMQIISLEEA